MHVNPDVVSNISTADPWHDLTDGLYIRPREICRSEQDAIRVEEAVKTIQEFLWSCEAVNEDFYQ